MKPTAKTIDPYKSRLAALRQRLRDATKPDIDAALIVNPNDTRYLTGFVGDDSWTLVTATGRKTTIISDTRFEEQIKAEAPPSRVTAVIRQQTSLAETLKKVVGDLKIKKLGVQKAYVTALQLEKIRDELGKKKAVPWDDGMLEQRSVKDAAEVALIRKAGRIQQEAYLEMLDYAEPGMREYEVAAFLEYRIRALGADGVSFRSIVAADRNAALPHAIPGRRKLKPGGIMLVDWGAKLGGYCSDMTRVVAFGSMKSKLREVYQVVLDAQQAGIDAIRPGANQRAVDEAARKVIEDAGYGKRFGHGLGHGLGLDIHEAPVLSPRADEDAELQAGHVVTVEPGIYLPGVGGVRIEDDVVVTDSASGDGHKVLTDLPKGLDSAII